MMGERFSIGAGLLTNTVDNMTEWILRAPELKKGIVMPGAQVEAGGMPPTGLSREEARAIAVYLASLRLPDSLRGRRTRPPSTLLPDPDPAPTTTAPEGTETPATPN
jgi:hypothetical protein